MADAEPDVRRICVKRYAAGKAIAHTRGDPAFAEQARRALQQSLVLVARIDGERFHRAMREQGVPDAVIQAYFGGITVDDEAWFQDVYPS